MLRSLVSFLAGLLERGNIIERSRLRATVDLAWPRVVTGFARMSKQTADVAMVGIVLGAPAIAGLAFAYAYWQLVARLSLGLSGGTISLVSQYYGGDQPSLANRAITQSCLLATVFSAPFIVLFAFGSEGLIGLLGAEPAALEYGTIYLTLLAPALLFEFYNKIASRVFAGIGDTLTPMVIRAGGAALNIVLNAILIFGLEMGVAGAAIGTVVATVLITAGLAWGLFGRPYPRRGRLPVRLTLAGPTVDMTLLRPLVRVSTPLIFQEVARAVAVFPLLAIAGIFGSTVVAAYEIGRRIRDLMNSLSWGFSIASSSLVGRHLGANEEEIATNYGDEIIRFSLVAYVIFASLVIFFADSIAHLFVTDPETLSLATTFIQIAAIATIGLGIDSSATGALRGAGDTRWPFYGALIGLYVFTLPIAYLGVITPLGVAALYVAMLTETYISAAITYYRYRTGAWRGVSRSIRERAGQSTD
ncbi:MATE family efflux transporter [Natrarchaeobius halalkaliphilus]|uniref:Multidrug-efflux transporter n=1 Tax=Natrarchaeobius halalkaliphilus TaxID=1679091 RepID=A0A3N6MT04_9EURY|nr:MATE family efflux transporter [Natrarchaeobius halalkaliphilus]RQG87905.1 MATE family efflux transporter [Natrarchaeobius halalkaliphilus]